MFLDNKYTKYYYSIINYAVSRELVGYSERHHIIPKCIGGSNDASNIVKLSAREHFICHRLLIKMVENTQKHKMAFAAWQQSRSAKYHGVKITARTYAILKEQLSTTYTGRRREPFSKKAKENMKIGALNRKKTAPSQKMLKHLKKIGARDKVGEKNPFFGKTHSEEFKKRKSEHNLMREKVTCIHCNRMFDVGMANRWHLDKCKFKP